MQNHDNAFETSKSGIEPYWFFLATGIRWKAERGRHDSLSLMPRCQKIAVFSGKRHLSPDFSPCASRDRDAQSRDALRNGA